MISLLAIFALLFIPYVFPATMIPQGSWNYWNDVDFSGFESACIDSSGLTTRGIISGETGWSLVDFESQSQLYYRSDGWVESCNTIFSNSLGIYDYSVPNANYGRVALFFPSSYTTNPSGWINLRRGTSNTSFSSDKWRSFTQPTIASGTVYQLFPVDSITIDGSSDVWSLVWYIYDDNGIKYGNALYKFSVQWGSDSPFVQGDITNTYQYVLGDMMDYWTRRTLGLFSENVMGVGVSSSNTVHSVLRSSPSVYSFDFGAPEIMATVTDLDTFFVMFTRTGLRMSGSFDNGWNADSTLSGVDYFSDPYCIGHIDPHNPGILWATGFNGNVGKFRTSDLSEIETDSTTLPNSPFATIDDDTNEKNFWDATVFSPRQNRLYAITFNSTVPIYSFTMENCASQSDCSSCIVDPTCAWCATENQCKPNSDLETCPGSGWRHENDNPGACDALVSALSPPKIPAISGSVTFSGLFFDSMSNSSCTIGGLSGSIGTVTSTSAVCTVADMSSLVGVSEFSNENAILNNEGVQYGPSYSTDVYNCGFYAVDSCSACTNSPCEYSVKSGTCDYTGVSADCGSSPCITTSSNCPNLVSVTPDSAQTGSSTPLEIKSNEIFYNNLHCFFGAPMNIIAAATYVDSSTITCTAPDSNSTQSVNLSIRDNTNNHSLTTTPISFEFFSCPVFGNDCQTCINQLHPNCFFCLQSQTCGTLSVDSCPGSHQVTNGNCPSISSVSPNPQFSSTSTAYTVTGNDFTAAGTYDCNFTDPNVIGGPNTVVSATRVNSNTLTCDTNVTSTGLGSSALTIMYNTTIEYTPTNEILDFVTCSNFLDCTSCSQIAPQLCGWCPDQAICAPSSSCPTFHTDQCAVVQSISPSNDAVVGGTPIVITSSISHGDSFNLSCYFEQGPNFALTNATVFDVPSRTFSCETPPYGYDGQWSISLTLWNTTDVFASAGPKLSVIICPQPYEADDCTEFMNFTLVRGGACGYCLDDDSASLPHKCSSSWKNNTCPEVSSFSPIKSLFKGGGDLIVDGFFSAQPTYFCHFNGVKDFIVPASYISQSQIKCPIPDVSSLSENGRVTSLVYFLSIYHNSVLYGSSVTFLFDDVQTSPDSPVTDDPTLAIVLPIVGAAMIFAVWYRHKYANADTVQLKLQALEPLVFGKLEKPLYNLTPEQEDILVQMDKLVFTRGLGGQSFPVIEILLGLTGVSESDKIAKALIFTSDKHNLAVDVCTEMIEVELATHHHEHQDDPVNARATLFRTNSHSTKLVKYLSRLIGIPYLWDTLASVLYDIITTTSSSNASFADAEEEAKSKSKAASSAESDDVNLTITRSKIESSNMEMNRDDSQAQYEAALQLELFSTKIFNRIVNSIHKIPGPLRLVYAKVAEEVSKYYPDSTNKALGGFFFLRFLTPAISTPEAYGVNPTGEPIQRTTRRSLVLVAKVMQNLANQVEFGRKEAFMVRMNRFIQDNIPNLPEFYNNLTEVSNVSSQFKRVCIPDEVVHTNCLVEICDHLIVNRDRVFPMIHERYGNAGNHFKTELEKMFNAFSNKRPEKL